MADELRIIREYDSGRGAYRTRAVSGIPGALPAETTVPANEHIISNKLDANDAEPKFRLMGDGKLEWSLTGYATDVWLEHTLEGRMVLGAKDGVAPAFSVQHDGSDNYAEYQIGHTGTPKFSIGHEMYGSTNHFYLYDYEGAYVMSMDGGTGGMITFGTAETATAQIDIRPKSADTVGLAVKAKAGQSADLQQWQDSSGTPMARITAAGAMQFFVAGVWKNVVLE